MDEKAINEIVENFKGMTWEELDDAISCMDIDELRNTIRMLKVRFG